MLDDNPCGHRHDNGLRDGMALACKGCTERAGQGHLWRLAQALSDLADVFSDCQSPAEVDNVAAITRRRALQLVADYG